MLAIQKQITYNRDKKEVDNLTKQLKDKEQYCEAYHKEFRNVIESIKNPIVSAIKPRTPTPFQCNKSSLPDLYSKIDGSDMPKDVKEKIKMLKNIEEICNVMDYMDKENTKMRKTTKDPTTYKILEFNMFNDVNNMIQRLL